MPIDWISNTGITYYGFASREFIHSVKADWTYCNTSIPSGFVFLYTFSFLTFHMYNIAWIRLIHVNNLVFTLTPTFSFPSKIPKAWMLFVIMKDRGVSYQIAHEQKDVAKIDGQLFHNYLHTDGISCNANSPLCQVFPCRQFIMQCFPWEISDLRLENISMLNQTCELRRPELLMTSWHWNWIAYSDMISRFN